LSELRSKEIVLGNVHAISGSQENMVDDSLASVIQAHFDPLPNRSSADNKTAEGLAYVSDTRDEPTGTPGPD
jgi:hypothetical protein